MPIINRDFTTRLPYVVRKPIELVAGIFVGLLGIIKSIVNGIIKKIAVYNEVQKKKREFKPFKDLTVWAYAKKSSPLAKENEQSRFQKREGLMESFTNIEEDLMSFGFASNPSIECTTGAYLTRYISRWLAAVLSSDIDDCIDIMSNTFEVIKKHDGGYRVKWSLKHEPDLAFQGCIEAEGSKVHMMANLDNGLKLKRVLLDNWIDSGISVPDRVMFSKTARNLAYECCIGPLRVLVERKPKRDFCSSYERYNASPAEYIDAARGFATISREFVFMNLAVSSTDNIHVVTLIKGFEEKTTATQLALRAQTPDKVNPFNLRFGNMRYTYEGSNSVDKSQAKKLVLHLTNIDRMEEVVKDANDGLNNVVQFVDAFVFFYLHAEEMLTTLKNRQVHLTAEQKMFLRYCSEVSACNAACTLRNLVVNKFVKNLMQSRGIEQEDYI